MNRINIINHSSTSYNDGYYDEYIDDDYNEEYLKWCNNENNYPFDDFDNYGINKEEENLVFNNKHSFTKKVDDLIDPEPLNYITDSFLNVLMVAEKPSIAKKLTEILSPKSPKYENKTNEMNWVYYTFEGYFKRIKAKFTVTSVKGHIYESNFRERHNDWEEIEAGDLYEIETIKTAKINKFSKKEKNNNKNKKEINIVKFLQETANNKDILCLWLDCDSEGENICYEVIYNVLPYMNKKEYQQIYRALFSSLAEEDINNAFRNISNYPDNNLSESVDAREIIDLKVGVSFSRLLTQEIYPSIKQFLYRNRSRSNMISYGPCQTPTLWFCVKRQREIENNKTKPYYKIYIQILVNDNEYKIYFDEEYTDKKDVLDLIEYI